jgi:hypothetical protein
MGQSDSAGHLAIVEVEPRVTVHTHIGAREIVVVVDTIDEGLYLDTVEYSPQYRTISSSSLEVVDMILSMLVMTRDIHSTLQRRRLQKLRDLCYLCGKERIPLVIKSASWVMHV